MRNEPSNSNPRAENGGAIRRMSVQAINCEGRFLDIDILHLSSIQCQINDNFHLNALRPDYSKQKPVTQLPRAYESTDRTLPVRQESFDIGPCISAPGVVVLMEQRKLGCFQST